MSNDLISTQRPIYRACINVTKWNIENIYDSEGYRKKL